LNTAKHSFHENKQIESSRFEGVSCSVLVVEYGHLAVTKRKASEEWLHAFSIFKPIEKNEKNYHSIEHLTNSTKFFRLH